MSIAVWDHDRKKQETEEVHGEKNGGLVRVVSSRFYLRV
jgi:hypothetical protein